MARSPSTEDVDSSANIISQNGSTLSKINGEENKVLVRLTL